MTKLIIQIPCLNEELTLPLTLAELPTQIPGIDAIETLIIDDGSTDKTVEVATAHGVNYVVRHTSNKGLAVAFQSGLNACLQLGADIIVNTDADNQYPGRYIPDLVQKILTGEADIVIGDRQTDTIEYFSPLKKHLQRLGSSVVRSVSGTEVTDAPSGFRAWSREAALRINVITGYTYTLETIIQAGHKNLTVGTIPVQTNAKLRESRLMRSMPEYVLRSATTIMRLYILYRPLKTFALLSLPFFTAGVLLWLRFLFLLLIGEAGRGTHIQSVIVGAAGLTIGFVILLFGLIGDLIAINRRLHEESLYYLKRSVLKDLPDDPSIETVNPPGS